MSSYPSNAYALSLIRAAANNTHLVRWSKHARDRMQERNVNALQVYAVMRTGSMIGAIEHDLKHDSFVCRLAATVFGEYVKVVVAIKMISPNVVVVTVMED